MKRTIRLGMFETNSSNTHSMIICSEEEYAKLENEELFIERWGESITDKKPVEDEDGYSEYQTLEEWLEDDYLEVDTNEYTTKSGEKIILMCKYGRDG